MWSIMREGWGWGTTVIGNTDKCVETDIYPIFYRNRSILPPEIIYILIEIYGHNLFNVSCKFNVDYWYIDFRLFGLRLLYIFWSKYFVNLWVFTIKRSNYIE